MTMLLEIRDLRVEVDGQEILRGLSLTIPAGEVHALLGPNGSGKTTLMMAVMGYPRYRVSGGHIFFDGQEIAEMGLTERARLGIGVAHQRPPTIAGVKLRQILDYTTSGDIRPAGELDDLVRAARMESFLDRDLNAGLSGGEIKRSELLQLLAARPGFALLDEPDSGVDLDSMRVLGDMVNVLFSRDPAHPAKRRTGLVITHTGRILDYVQADKAHVMIGGRIACSGNPILILETVSEWGYEECARCINGRSMRQ